MERIRKVIRFSSSSCGDAPQLGCDLGPAYAVRKNKLHPNSRQLFLLQRAQWDDRPVSRAPLYHVWHCEATLSRATLHAGRSTDMRMRLAALSQAPSTHARYPQTDSDTWQTHRLHQRRHHTMVTNGNAYIWDTAVWNTRWR